jgi:hypothetical protein
MRDRSSNHNCCCEPTRAIFTCDLVLAVCACIIRSRPTIDIIDLKLFKELKIISIQFCTVYLKFAKN